MHACVWQWVWSAGGFRCAARFRSACEGMHAHCAAVGMRYMRFPDRMCALEPPCWMLAVRLETSVCCVFEAVASAVSVGFCVSSLFAWCDACSPDVKSRTGVLRFW
jgi:hypothetical protein